MAEEEGGGSSERWLVSYSDFMTLLMIMFVVLYSLGQVDVAKYKELAESFRAAFSFGNPANVVAPDINQVSGSQTNGQPNPISIPGIPESPPESDVVAQQLTNLLARANLGTEISVKTTIEGVLISLSEKLLFDPGTAYLQQDAYPVLDTILTVLNKIDSSIQIVGYTDNTPPTDPLFKDNWALSAGRAVVIADYMIQNGFDPARITISGKGQNNPIYPNDTPEHRALNSRADIVVIYNVDENNVGLDSNVLNSN